MIDLDDALATLLRSDFSWGETPAVRLADKVARTLDLSIQYEPGDEEWAIWHGTGPYLGMISVRLPVAIVTSPLARSITTLEPRVAIVVIEDFLEENIRATASLLRSTVLRYGWDDSFDTEAFSANDLFVESV